jgi:hypothetical protein
MRFASINGQSHSEIKYPDMVDFFTEHTFFKFMSSGREGLMDGAVDAFDNMVMFFAVQKKTKKAQQEATEGADAFRDEVLRYGQKKMIDGFITHGSRGLKQGVFDMGMFIHQKMNFQQ